MGGPGRIDIEDPDDPRLDLYRNLTDAAARRSLEGDHGVFVAEGTTVIRRLLRSPYTVRSLLLMPSRADDLAADLERSHVDEVFVTGRALLAQVVGFDVHRGALAIAERRPLPAAAAVLERARSVAILEGLNDHENLGAIARSASALGIDALLLDPTCADPLYRRTVRVSMGEILTIPWTRLAPWPAALDDVRTAGFSVVALTPASTADPLTDALDALTGPVALLLGAEGPGLSAGALAAADRHARIPMRSGADSLNVGHAAAIAFHALARRP